MTTSRVSRAAGLPVTVKRGAPAPMAAQITGQFREAATSGVLGAAGGRRG